MDIDGWLRGIGLPQYAELFRANGIDGELLGRLTNDDLKDIGVASFGHRKKLLEAIAELGGGPTAVSSGPSVTPAPIPATTAPALISASVEAAGERRYLTVMFCDLVGSTGIAAKLDAEEWRDLVGGYLDTASAAIAEMGGHVAKKLGDGLLALFGYPVAQENDAERAARAALSIQRALADLNRKNTRSGKPELAARVGLDTGPAVVDAAGEVYGDVANVAARVQALAEPGSVLITARVQRQVAGLFVVEERGFEALKGVPEPTALYRLVRASGGGRRSRQRNLTPLVGRDEEIALLMRRWERVRQGEGQLVLVSGEPGIGKSRLIEEFQPRLRDKPHTWAEWTCSQLLQNTPFHPIAEWGRQRFGGADVLAEQRLADLESSLAQVKLDPAEYAPLLAPMLDIPLPKERTPALAAEELRRRQLAAATNWAIASARIQPVVLALEDAHWADPTTLEVLRGIAERGALAPVLVLITARPEFKPPWGMRSHHSTVSLAPLDRAQVQHIVSELAARHALPKDVVDGVAERAGGVPLFVEEVTRLLLDRGEQGGIQAIPPTLQQSLTARLDRLGSAREVAQVGSVIGRGFSYGLLRDVAGLEDGPLQAALEKLAEADIVLVQGLPPDSDYRFKHALIQDAAYENLLKSRRQVLHRRVAETLRDRFAATAAAEPEALAHHLTQAGMTDAAIEWWGKAGDQALRRSAFQEAIAHLGKAIEMADKAEEGASRAAPTPASSEQRLKLQTSYGQAMMWSKGYVAEETQAAFARARDLTPGIENPAERFVAYFAQWAGSAASGQFALAREAAETLRREAENEGRATERVVGLRLLGLTCLLQGDLIEAQANLKEALRTYDPDRDRDAQFRFGQDAGAAVSTYLAFTNWLLGDVGDTRARMEEAFARAAVSNPISTRANIYHLMAIFELARGKVDAARRAAQAVVDISREYGLAFFSFVGAASNACARARLGDPQAAAAGFRDALAKCAEQGIKGLTTVHRGLLAELEAEAQDVEAALARIDEALALAAETGEHWTDAFLYRIRGEILLKRDPASTAPAEGAFLTAIAIAQQQKARSFELPAALALAKLYRSTNRPADAYAVLAPALEGFSPTPEFPEIEEAQTLLAALAETDEVKNAAASRQRRLKLQASYGQAVMFSQGFASEETKAAFARVQELAAGINNPDERFNTYHGLWAGNLLRGEIRQAREMAEVFLREAEKEARPLETVFGHRILGITCLVQGDLLEAQGHCKEALRTYDPERDREAKFRFGMDPGVTATTMLANVNWLLGELGQTRELIEEGVTRAVESGHVPTQGFAYTIKVLLEAVRGDAEATLRASAASLDREHTIDVYLPLGFAFSSWARAQLGERETGLMGLRRALTEYANKGNKLFLPFCHGLLAEVEATVDGAEKALAQIDGALALAGETGEHWTDAILHRVRGEILLKRDPTNTAPAGEAFLTAIAIAQQQRAMSFELRAALSLANLYQSMDRIADAHAVLAPALEGFSPTPEFPEIEEAQQLLGSLGS